MQGTHSNLSVVIWAQLVLMIITYLLYNAVDIYKVSASVNHNYLVTLPEWVQFCNLLASGLFMMQHTLFVGQYARIAVALPLTFCIQSEQVQQKRRVRLNLVMVGEIIFALVLICEFYFQVKQGYNYQISWITFTSAAVFIAIVLGSTFWYLSSLNK